MNSKQKIVAVAQRLSVISDLIEAHSAEMSPEVFATGVVPAAADLLESWTGQKFQMPEDMDVAEFLRHVASTVIERKAHKRMRALKAADAAGRLLDRCREGIRR